MMEHSWPVILKLSTRESVVIPCDTVIKGDFTLSLAPHSCSLIFKSLHCFYQDYVSREFIAYLTIIRMHKAEAMSSSILKIGSQKFSMSLRVSMEGRIVFFLPSF